MKNFSSNQTDPNSEFSRPLYLNSIIFAFGLLLSAINGSLLHKMFQQRNKIKAKRYMFLINMTFCDLLAGLIMIFLAIVNVFGGDGPLVCFLQGETCLNMCVTMCTYTAGIIIQFVAIRYPIYYQMNITKCKIVCVLVICWILAAGFSGTKLAYAVASNHGDESVKSFNFFPYLDVVLKSMYLIGNGVCYIYVLAVALKRRRQQLPVQNFENNTRAPTEDVAKLNETTPLQKSAVKFARHYEAILTSGIRLLVYFVTCVPLTIYCAYVLATDPENATNPGKVYGHSRDAAVGLVLLWFCRAIVDPLITLVREKPMTSDQYSRTSRRSTHMMSIMKSRYSRVSKTAYGDNDVADREQ